MEKKLLRYEIMEMTDFRETNEKLQMKLKFRVSREILFLWYYRESKFMEILYIIFNAPK